MGVSNNGATTSPATATSASTTTSGETDSEANKSQVSATTTTANPTSNQLQEKQQTQQNPGDETSGGAVNKLSKNSNEQSQLHEVPSNVNNSNSNSAAGKPNASSSAPTTATSLPPRLTASSISSSTGIPNTSSSSGPSNDHSASGSAGIGGGGGSSNSSTGRGNAGSSAYFPTESNGQLGARDHGRNNTAKSAETNPQQQQNSYQHHNKQQQHQHHHHHHHHNNSNQQQQQSHQQSHQHQNQHLSHHHNKEQLSKTNLYIRGLNADTSDNDLFSLCNRYGSIVSAKAILDKNTSKCKGYGFVDFETPAAAEIAVLELQKQGILVHMAKQQEADPTNLYIANLPQMMTESELENLLRPYGQVVSTRILINQHRQPRGVGFARMETKEQCDSIIASLNGQIVKGSKEPLLVKFADGASKKRVHHFQHKPLGGNAFMGDHLWRNSSNDTNYHMMNSGPGNRNFHGSSFDHTRQNHAMSHHNNGLVKHQQMMSPMSGYHPHHQGGGHHTHSSALHDHQQHHQSQLQQHHHGPNHSSHSSHRNQNQGPYTGGSNFPLSASMSGANDASQWLHPPQAGQPYVLQPPMLAPTPAIDPSLHYVNLANQMQGLQIGNPAVSGYLSLQQWPVWPSGVGAKHSGTSQQSTNHGGSHSGYNDAD